MELKKYKRIKNGLPSFAVGRYPGAGLIEDLTKDVAAKMFVDTMRGKGDDSFINENLKDKYYGAWEDMYKDGYLQGGVVAQNNQPEKKDGLNYGNALVNAGGLAGTLYNAFQPAYDKNDLINNANVSTAYRYGVPYQMKTVDTASADKNASQRWWGKTLGSAVQGYKTGSSLFSAKNGKLPNFSMGASAAAGLGVGIGSWIAGTIGAGIARKKELQQQAEAQDILNRENIYRGDIAGTRGIQDMYAEENLDPTQQRLKFSCGKKPKFDGGKRVRSGFGLVDLPQTGWGNGGEEIIQYAPDGTELGRHILPKTGNGTDTYPIYQDAYTEIIPTKIVDKMRGYKNGKLPKYDPGKWAASNWGNVASALSGLGAGLSQYVLASEPVGKYNFTTINPYLAQGMRTLNSLRVSDYPLQSQMSKAFAKHKYAINNSGASGGLRSAYNTAAVNSLYDTYANMMMQNIIQNNAYKSDAAKTGITAYGQQQQLNSHEAIAARQMADQASANAHLGKQQAIYNIDNTNKNYIKEYNKINLFKLMYGLWSNDLDLRRDELKNRRRV